MAEARSARSAAAGGTERPRRTSASGAGSAPSGGRSGSSRAGSSRGAADAASSARDPRVEAGDGGFGRANPLAGGHVCPVAFCPVGMALTFAEAARPEVVQHLMAAGTELMLAVKAMIDARAEAVARSGGLEHIRIR